MADLYTALSDFDDSQAKQVKTYSGLLGLPTSNKTVDVPDRNGYVYVRLRDNQSEIIQAFNEKVSAVYNLPVLVARQGNRWVIVSRDIERYENWGSYSAFIPAHAHQHEFNRDDPGGDVVFSYVDQFMPLNVYPSGTPGSPNVLVGAYSFKKNDSTWAYVGNTGTASVLIHKPTNNQARIVLVYLDRATGNPGILVNSGTSFAANLTGTHDILQYLPSLTSTQEPLKAIRLVSGTTYVGWDNLYDIRQFFGGTGGSAATGTHSHEFRFAMYQEYAPFTVDCNPYALAVGQAFDITDFAVGTFVTTTNDGDNYWTVTVKRLTDGSDIATIDTSSDDPDGWMRHSDNAPTITSLTTLNVGAYVRVTKTGSPGNLYLAGPVLIGTYQ